MPRVSHDPYSDEQTAPATAGGSCQSDGGGGATSSQAPATAVAAFTPVTGDYVAASAVASGGRPLRVIALHGGIGNSNIMKFQTSRLRALLGKSAEWYLPNGLEPFVPIDGLRAEDAKTPGELHYAERPDIEKTLAKGMPFYEWFTFNEYASPNLESYERSWRWLLEYTANLAPVDVIVAYTSSSQIVNRAAEELRREGKRSHWRMNVFFCGDPPLPAEGYPGNEDDVFDVLPQTTLLVAYKNDPVHDHLDTASFYRRFFTNQVLLEHDEGRVFPTHEPRTTQIYTEVVERIRNVCGVPLPPVPPSAPRDSGPVGAPTLAPQRLAEFLLKRKCVVADARGGGQPFPGARSEDIGLRSLQLMRPAVWQQRLSHLLEDGRQIVVVSQRGDLCAEYCQILKDRFSFKADRVLRLAGGVDAWAAWESEHRQQSNEVRLAYGLAADEVAEVATIGPGRLAEMLLAEACLVADVRELAETRGRAFPGAQKDLSLLTLRRKPAEASLKLSRLLEDDRPLVTISATGVRCRPYCALLVEKFGFKVEKLLRLDGGLHSWDQWSAENEDQDDACRQAYGLPRSRGRTLVPGGQEGWAAARERSREVDQ